MQPSLGHAEHLRRLLGRAKGPAGDVRVSREAYERALGCWKDADPDGPSLRGHARNCGRLIGPFRAADLAPATQQRVDPERG